MQTFSWTAVSPRAARNQSEARVSRGWNSKSNPRTLIRPGDKRVVHHANILVDRGQSARRQESERGAGFAGMELKIESENFDPDSHFFFWKPGTVLQPEPEGMALRLDKDTDLI